MRLFTTISIGIAAALLACAVTAQGPTTAPEHTIKEVMAKAYKPPANLLRKVAQDKASDEEKAELLALMKVLAENTPSRGDEASWGERTGLLVSAAQAAVDGQADAGKQLTKAANCAQCHREHK